jgi:1-acylglycerone phosphate reductase
MIVNITSRPSMTPTPMAGVYSMSKPVTLTGTLRLELAPIGIKVVYLKTGAAKSNLFDNQACPRLPEGPIYVPTRKALEEAMNGVGFMRDMMDGEKWAAKVVADLLASSPPGRVWRGYNAWPVWFVRQFMPWTFLDGKLSRLGGLDVVRNKVKKAKIT